MKIAINAINSNINPRGVDRYIIELIKHLYSIDGSIDYYVYYADWQNFMKVLNLPKIHLIELKPPKNNLLRALWQIFSFPQILSENNPDILHYSTPIPFIRKKCPVISTIHDLAEFSDSFKYGRIKSWFKRIIVKNSLRLSDRIITVSNYSKQQIRAISELIPEKISVISEGVSSQWFEQRNCSNIILKYCLPDRYILFVGAIEEGKNIDTLLYTFSSLQSSMLKDLNIILVGNKGRGFNKIAGIIEKLNLKHKVYILGYVPDEDLFCLYNKAKIFIFPSIIEGFGLPVLEAMASGVPVIASNRTSLPEVCKDAAILVDPFSKDEMRTAIEKILEDKVSTNTLIEKGYKRAKMLSWNITAKETLDQYRKMVLMNNI